MIEHREKASFRAALATAVFLLLTVVILVVFVYRSLHKTRSSGYAAGNYKLMVGNNAYKVLRDGSELSITAESNDILIGLRSKILDLEYSPDSKVTDLRKPLTDLSAYGIGKYQFVYGKVRYPFFLPGFPSTTINGKFDHPTGVYDFDDIVRNGIKSGIGRNSRIVLANGNTKISELVQCMEMTHEIPELVFGCDTESFYLLTGKPADW